MGAVWNPADKDARLVLSNSNKTVARNATSGGSNPIVRGLNPKSSGKWWTEFTIDAADLSAKNLGFGIATAAWSTYIGDGTTNYGIYTSGSAGYNGSFPSLTGTLAAGDRIGLAYDADAKRAWISRNDVWLNGSPAAGTGGQVLQVSAAMMVAASPTATNGADKLSITSVGTPPAGFSAWDGDGATAIGATGPIALGAITSASAAALPVKAAGSQTMASVTSSGVGGAPLAAIGAIGLALIAATAGGVLPISAAATSTLDGITSNAASSLPVAAASSTSFDTVSTVSAARSDIYGVSATTLDSLSSTATARGQSLATAAASSVFGSIATTSVSVAQITANASALVATIASNSGAAGPVRGTAAVVFGSVVSSSLASIPDGARAAADLGTIQSLARGTVSIIGNVASQLLSVSGAAAGTVAQDVDGQLVGPGWSLLAVPRRFIASAVRRSFIVSSTGCKRMLNFPPKYAHEVRNAVVDFAPALSDGEGLVGQPTVAVLKGDLVASGARIAGTAVHFTLSAGTAGAKPVQWLEVHCATDGEQVLEEVVSVTMLS